MAKKKSDKETEPKKVSTKRFSAFLKNETTHFVIGLISVIFAVYLLLAFTSFFFTGAADQSILDNQQPGELMQTANHVKNYAGARGAQLAEFLINECFGLAAYFIILFLAVVGMKLMKAYQFRIWKWFMSCSILLIWFSITLGFIFDGTFGDSFIYPGGLHGHNVSNWLISQIGIPGLGLLLFIAALLFFIYLSNETILVIRKALRPSFRRKKKEDQTISATEENPIKEAPRKEESRKEFSNPGPAIVDFELEQPTKKEEEVEEQVPFPFESKQVTEPAVIEEPAYTNEEEEVENTDEPDFSISEETNEEDEAYKGPVLPPYNPRLDLENYKFPSLDLLNEYEDDGPNIDMEEQNANKDRIIKVLRSFGIEISSIKASVGPTITLYEITPAEGVRISKIRNLEDDIALSLKSLRENIGMVQQDVFIFPDTIMENIRYGRLSASDEEVIEAAKMAEIHDDIMDMKAGYQTYVGERGAMLSGGQKQRLSIARMFLKNPPIVLLDEATSALDSVTEMKIQEALDRL